eukprot:TRINITY_DN27463_c0_g1_i1.p1 TRINITY_DN27463_c0_g1~~TRINITY_DN27463_c0_g1_i1.p1  ORF type:complete len:672 (+),score=118.40 TRINITY_DN27463_c0_g1_i1:23-2017(+)
MDARLAGDIDDDEDDDWLDSVDAAVVPSQPTCAPQGSSFEAALATLASLHHAEVQRLQASATALLGELAELRDGNGTSYAKQGNGTSAQGSIGHYTNDVQSLSRFKEGIDSLDHIAVPMVSTSDDVRPLGPQKKGPNKRNIARQLEPKGTAFDPGSLTVVDPVPDTVDREATPSNWQTGMEFLGASGFKMEKQEVKRDDLEEVKELIDETNGLAIQEKGHPSHHHEALYGPRREVVGGGVSADPELKPKVGMILDTVSASVVLVNALAIGVSSDVCEDCVEWEVLEMLFLTFYVSEALFKICMLGCNAYICGRDRYWNWFDIVCILSSFADIAISYIILPLMAAGRKVDMGALMIIKLFRMLRILRVIRTLRFEIFKELKMMILGVYSGLRSLFWAIVLLIAIAFVLGVAARMFYSEYPEFSSVDAAMFTLFRCFTDGCAAYDGTPLPERLRGGNPFIIVVVYILITMIVTVGLFNLIMATFIDNVVSAQDEKRQQELGNTADDVLHQLKHALCELEEDEGHMHHQRTRLTQIAKGHNKSSLSKVMKPEDEEAEQAFDRRFSRLAESQFCVTRDKWREWLARGDFLALLKDADISASNKMELFDALDADGGGELNIEELLYGLMKLRGPVSKSEIVAIRVKISYMCQLLQDHLLGSAQKVEAEV